MAFRVKHKINPEAIRSVKPVLHCYKLSPYTSNLLLEYVIPGT